MTTKKLNEQHQDMVSTLAKPGQDIIDSLNPSKAHIWHMATGIATEAGELLDNTKREVIYNKPPNRENLVEELGDLEFYMQGIRQAYNITRDETLKHNLAKLAERYKAYKYSDKQALERNDKKGGE